MFCLWITRAHSMFTRKGQTVQYGYRGITRHACFIFKCNTSYVGSQIWITTSVCIAGEGGRERQLIALPHHCSDLNLPIAPNTQYLLFEKKNSFYWCHWELFSPDWIAAPVFAFSGENWNWNCDGNKGINLHKDLWGRAGAQQRCSY